jgi:AbrB family looped-hinge helix DNA binding protein
MRTTIDAAGRVVVPKPLRDALRLRPGIGIDIDERDGRLVLEPVSVPKRAVRRGRGFVAEPVEAIEKLTAAEVRKTLEASRR